MKLLMSRYNQDTSKSKAELNNLRNQVDVLNTDLDMRASYCADLEKSCTELRTKCTDLESALRDIKEQMCAKEEENEKLQKKLSVIKQAIGENV
jgi:chromosome segregation ATPase